ncbi:hypothetical protein GCM10009801_14420 [Streptomyces albiaxialis]|uniref:Uncharacterized protein n=1 Tax=Streptomyces albiaxialis TaxID=329523 RepID=A0ABP5HE57_9ACTN
MFPAWNLLPADAREVFREALAVDDATWIRGRGRTLSQALIALPTYRRTNPAMAHNARHVIRAVLDEDRAMPLCAGAVPLAMVDGGEARRPAAATTPDGRPPRLPPPPDGPRVQWS